ncbi:MAG: hypothetical protein IT381_31985 [Deltaproteobacteria bacterium]|nr:hypothetical protein [Deltaproteobacteria bacterium]
MLLALVLIAAPTIGPCSQLPANHIFNTPIADLPVHPNSAAFLQTISATPRNLHLDLGQQTDQTQADFYGIPYQVVAGGGFAWPRVRYESEGVTDDAAPDESDCANSARAKQTPCTSAAPYFLIPPSPLVEGGIVSDQSVYGDHHILVVDSDTCLLWESYHAYPNGVGGWDILSSAVWDLKSTALRPATWTSADAAGFPILPLLLRADEASTGTIAHALRFTIESDTIRTSYTWPATHKTNRGDASIDKPQMGQLFRLKASFQAPNNWNTQSKAIVQALKTYGMYLADGGSDMYITGDPSSDWQDSTFSQVQSIPHTHFEAVDLTPLTTHASFDANSAAAPGVAAPTGSSGSSGGASAGGGEATPNPSGTPGGGSTNPSNEPAVKAKGCASAPASHAWWLLVAALFVRRRLRI